MHATHPMRPIEFLLLAVLNDRPRHGYGIVREIERRTNGHVKVKPGNLYRVLDRLLQRDLLHEEEGMATDQLGDERRRYYRISANGRNVLAEEARLLGGIVDEVRGDLSAAMTEPPR